MMYTANQPLYFPAVYMVNRFFWCNEVVVMMEAQYSKFGHQSRALIGTKNGEQSLILPLRDRSYKRLNEVEVDLPVKWVDKLGKTLQTVYGQFPMYKEHAPGLMDRLEVLVEEALEEGCPPTQAKVGLTIMEWMIELLGLKCRLHLSTQLIPERPQDASTWVADLGAVLGATEYLGGEVAMKAYVRPEIFAERGISLVTQNYVMPPYQGVAKVMTDGSVCVLDPLFTGGVPLVMDLVGRPYAVREA